MTTAKKNHAFVGTHFCDICGALAVGHYAIRRHHFCSSKCRFEYFNRRRYGTKRKWLKL